MKQLSKIIEVNGYIDLSLYVNLSNQIYYEKRNIFPFKNTLGDFTTAPNLSPIFGEVIGAYFLDYILTNNIKNFTLLELGGGNGLLMADICRVLSHHNIFDYDIWMVEQSKHLQAVQQSNITHSRTTWMQTVSKLPTTPIFVVANEFFDALGADQYIKRKDCWHKRIIALENEELKFNEISCNPFLNTKLNSQYPLAYDGSIIELCQLYHSYIVPIAYNIAQNDGMMLVFDYGYYEQPINRTAFGETLSGILNHKHVPVLDYPGEADLSFHVDFYHLEQLALQEKVYTKLTTMSEFLVNNGYKERLKAQYNKDSDHLIDENKMGKLFKTLEIRKANC